MVRVVVLTVAESKRLIAKGVTNLDLVKKALHKGMIAIARGTTNGYVAEEILGRKIDKTSYVLGVVLPGKKRAPSLPRLRGYERCSLGKRPTDSSLRNRFC